ncbi:MAG: prepilin-type N-terminal cleavage/methylation domain-containing protein [Lactimicrobium massiliense]|nr:prepilin-type N-terminal cleavage/methylation domain-containing protein [Lactimicrobium massiliense]MDD6727384.1 prepilin-type N-terminal cleavage/methylation domain-containing protein [Lactimicrobium massiliense]
MNNSRKKKGFTLAELLIVVAIIAVLVAISIPIFTSQLEKAREATDLANLRAAYAECSTSVLTGEASSSNVKAGTASGSYYETIDVNQKKSGWTGDNANAKIGTFAVSSLMASDDVKKMTVSVEADGTVTIADGETHK